MTITSKRPIHVSPHEEARTEELAARLTEAAYGVALQHGIKGCFLDLELALWQALRAVVEPGEASAGERRSCA